jgi:pimeloyl-ACP methyl ester carboxylesterase
MPTLRSFASLVHDAVDHTVDLVDLGHEVSARSALRLVDLLSPPLSPAAREVDSLRRGLTRGVLGSIKGVNRLVEEGLAPAYDAVSPPAEQPAPPLPLRSDLVGQAAWLLDAAQGAANGVAGDHLHARGNRLDLGLRLRSATDWIELDGIGIPEEASAKVVVFVHGLATTEWSWCLDAARHHGDPGAHFGSLLQAELGFTPIFVRYNTGRRILDNGAALAKALAALVLRWPVPIEQLVLIGHSMGGLVLRGALVAGAAQPWVGRVSHLFTLGSPHKGAPLERVGQGAVAALEAVELPAPAIIAALLRGRSAGIQDLGLGRIHEEETPPPFPAQLDWHFVSAGVATAADHPWSLVLGDLLVPIDSAAGPEERPLRSTAHFVGGLHHGEVQIHPAVYAVIRTALSAS